VGSDLSCAPASCCARAPLITIRNMNHPPEQLPVTIPPDARAYRVLLIAFSPLLLIWGLGWWRRGSANTPLIAMIAALGVAGLYLVWNKTVRVDLSEISQGWPPFRTRISYHHIGRVRRIYVSSRYGSTLCLGIAEVSSKKKIVLPLKSFSLAKRKQIVEILKMRAPQARIDASCLLG
jgi:hypothetical protein